MGYVLGVGKLDKVLLRIIQIADIFLITICHGFIIFPLPNISAKEVNVSNWNINVNKKSKMGEYSRDVNPEKFLSP